MCYQNREEEGMSRQSQKAENQVDDVIEDLCIRTDLLYIPRKRSSVAHDAQQMNSFQ